MSITVSQLCSLPIFQQGFRLISNPGEGLNRYVQNITVMEVPDFVEFELGQDLFVLTTLYSFKDDLDQACKTFRRLCEKNVSAIGIKIDRFVHTVPPGIVAVVDEYQVPLFRIEKFVAFRDVIKAISTEIINEHYSIIAGLNLQHETLLSSILRGDKIENFINLLGDSLQCYCACLTLSGKIMVDYTPPGFQEKAEIDAFLADEGRQLQELAVGSTSFKGYWIFPCLVYNQIMGYLLIKHEKPLSERELLLTKQIVSFLSIKFQEHRLRIEIEQRMIANIVDEILIQNHADESIILERIKFLGIQPQNNYFIIIVSCHENETEQVSSSTWQDLYSTMLKKYFANSAVLSKGDKLLSIVSVKNKSPYLQNGAIPKTLLQMISETSHQKGYSVYLGYSMIIKDLKLLPKCYEESQKAIKLGRIFRPKAKVYTYSDFIKEGLLLHSMGTFEHLWFKNSIIDTIQEYDQKYHAELWNTLEKSLNSSSLEKAAQELHIHTSTLRYRLSKIYTLTSADFFSPDGRFLLKLAYILEKLDSI